SVRRLKTARWNGRPVRETEAFDAFFAAGSAAEGRRLGWEGPPGRGPCVDLRGVALGLHATRVRIAEELVVLLVVPDAVQRAAAGADQAADERALAAAGDGSAGCADRGAAERADPGILADLDELAL